MDTLPSEVVVKILQNIFCVNALHSCELVCRRMRKIVQAHSTELVRTQANCKITLAKKVIITLEPRNSHGAQTIMELSDRRESEENVLLKFSRVELVNLTFAGHSSEEEDKIKWKTLLRLLRKSCQYRLQTIVFECLKVNDEKLCTELLNFVAQKYCQHISFKDCALENALSESHIRCMRSLRQFTWSDCNPSPESPQLDIILSKFAHNLRYERKRSAPFYVKSPAISTSSICRFIECWIHMPDAPFFDIIVDDCDQIYMNHFLEECESQSLSQIRLEFPSIAHPTAHVKAKFNPVEKRLKVFSIIDVPARSSGSLICFARYFRDF
ncbi:hypothetical protein DdX_02244 [Ditylenchus destructor]|uniref:F-box domain-containing protein n=1 Tax=Ditylenchus destructor TaxID=166010 RepID=A0AAD4RC27_9BILA|nr:hypothetical protein DdX_02244 [Ditylenchus destructor]